MASEEMIVASGVSANDCLVLAVPAGVRIALSPEADVIAARLAEMKSSHRVCVLGSDESQVESWIARIHAVNPGAWVFGVSRPRLALKISTEHDVRDFVDFKDESLVIYDRDAEACADFDASWLLRDQRLAVTTAFKQSGFNLREMRVTNAEVDCWIETAVDGGLVDGAPLPIRQNAPGVLLDRRAVEFLRESLEKSRQHASEKVAEWLVQSAQPGSKILISEAVFRRIGIPRVGRLKEAGIEIQPVRDGEFVAQVGAARGDISKHSWYLPPRLIRSEQGESPPPHGREGNRTQAIAIVAFLAGVGSLLVSGVSLTHSPTNDAALGQLNEVAATEARIRELLSDAEKQRQVQVASESSRLDFVESKVGEQRTRLDSIDSDLARIRDTAVPGLRTSFEMITQGVQFIPTNEGGRIALLGKDQRSQVELSTDVAGGKIELLDSQNQPMLRVEAFDRAGRLRLWKAGVNSPIVVMGAGGTDSRPSGEIHLFDGSKHVRLGVGGDIAEAMSSPAGDLRPGAVVRVHPQGHGVAITEADMDTAVIGVVSGAGNLSPAMVIGGDRDAKTQVPVAVSGTVYVQATTIRGPITPGDLLVSSLSPGRARAAEPYEVRPGALLGTALSRLDEGEGLVLMWVRR